MFTAISIYFQDQNLLLKSRVPWTGWSNVLIASPPSQYLGDQGLLDIILSFVIWREMIVDTKPYL